MIRCYRNQGSSFLCSRRKSITHFYYVLNFLLSGYLIPGMFTALVPSFKLEVPSFDSHSAHLLLLGVARIRIHSITQVLLEAQAKRKKKHCFSFPPPPHSPSCSCRYIPMKYF